MPSSEDILQGLTEIARSRADLAIFWHVYFGILVITLAFGYRCSRRVLGVLLAIPLGSVSVLAWLNANPFNGTLFALGAIALVVLGARLGQEKVAWGPRPAIFLGGLLFIFGWIYPHFLDTPSWLVYLYAAPLGLIPCPTLSAVAGLAIMLGGLGSASWPAVLGALGLFYGSYGAVVLGVTMDWALFAGSVCLLALCIRNARNR